MVNYDPRDYVHLRLQAITLQRRSRRSWHLRLAGSIIFLGAGLFFLIHPPMTAATFFETTWLSLADGLIFAMGGSISLWGVVSRRADIERLGVSLVVIAGLFLFFIQTTLMFPGDRVVWTRGGHTLVYLGFATWALDRWIYLGDVIEVIVGAARVKDENDLREVEEGADGDPI